MAETINVTLLLRKELRTQSTITRVQEIASGLGLVPTTIGRVSISAKVLVEDFVKLFQVSPKRISPSPPGQGDFGSPGGFEVEEEIPIPKSLTPFVETITVMPPARRVSQ